MYMFACRQGHQHCGHENFDASWKEVFYTMKRRAWISEDCLVIHCVPEEIELYHRSPLQNAVVRANNCYRADLLAQQRHQAAIALQQEQESSRIAALKDQIKFH